MKTNPLGRHRAAPLPANGGVPRTSVVGERGRGGSIEAVTSMDQLRDAASKRGGSVVWDAKLARAVLSGKAVLPTSAPKFVAAGTKPPRAADASRARLASVALRKPAGAAPATSAAKATALTLAGLLDSSRSVRGDPAMRPCMGADFRPSRGWHLPVGQAALAVLGCLGELVVDAPSRTSEAVAAASATSTLVCVLLAAMVLADQPFSRHHEWKRWPRTLVLLLAVLTAWLTFVQLRASAALPGADGSAATVDGEAAETVPVLAFACLELAVMLVTALLVAVLVTLAQDTAVAVCIARTWRQRSAFACASTAIPCPLGRRNTATGSNGESLGGDDYVRDPSPPPAQAASPAQAQTATPTALPRLSMAIAAPTRPVSSSKRALRLSAVAATVKSQRDLLRRDTGDALTFRRVAAAPNEIGGVRIVDTMAPNPSRVRL